MKRFLDNQKSMPIVVAMLVAGTCSACLGEEKQSSQIGHCDAGEKVYFSCVARSGKTLSLCGLESNDDTVKLSYRFGSIAEPEFTYPNDTHVRKDDFFYNHYVRPRADYFEVGFVNEGFEYRVFQHYDADLSPDARSGVSVEELSLDSAPTVVACITHPQGEISQLSEFLPCNRESALGCTN